MATTVHRPTGTDDEPATRVSRNPWIDRGLALGIALAAFAALFATSHDYAIVWDEANMIEREEILTSWFALALGGPRSRAEAFAPDVLEESWQWAREEPYGHTPFFALLSLVGWWATRGVLDPLGAYRVGPMLLASATAAAIFLHLRPRYGRLAGLTGAAVLLTIPQCFSLAHYTHYDMPMACAWVLAQIAFLRGLRRARWAPAFGLFLGLSAGSKFTGLFAAAAPMAWTALFEWLPRIRLTPSRRPAPGSGLAGTRTLLIGLPVAALTLYAILPPWWSDPLRGVSRFLASNLTRHDTVRIPTYYLGQIYGFALPWHNSIVLTAVTIPVLVLVLGLLGIVGVVARRPFDREGFLWVLSWLVLMVVRALPNAPGHDGVRQLLASTLSLAVLAGIGAGRLADWLRPLRAGWLAAALAAAAIGEGIVGIVQLYPYTLSYYNVAIGGLKGAERNGFEVTFYWDTLGPEFLRWVRDEHRRRRLELRFPIGLRTLFYLRKWGELPADIPIVPFDDTEAPDYVLQRRRGTYYPYDWYLEEHGRPRFVIRRQGVDLLRVYSYEESDRAYQATKDQKIPEYLLNY